MGTAKTIWAGYQVAKATHYESGNQVMFNQMLHAAVDKAV